VPKKVKHVPVKKRWWSGHVNEKDLAKVIAKAEHEGWEYEELENHGWELSRKWVARFSKETKKEKS